MAFDPKRLSTLDWLIVGGGAVVLLSTFMPWYGVDVGPFSASVSGWSSGFLGWFGALLLILAAVYVALRRSDVALPEMPVTPAVVAAGLSLIGVLFVVWRWATLPRAHTLGRAVDYGPRFGIWLALLAGIVETVGAVMQFRSSGEALPWGQHTDSQK